ncbi:hypothetical protein Aduo_002035 [Ancylostoma duodenale]
MKVSATKSRSEEEEPRVKVLVQRKKAQKKGPVPHDKTMTSRQQCLEVKTAAKKLVIIAKAIYCDDFSKRLEEKIAAGKPLI